MSTSVRFYWYRRPTKGFAFVRCKSSEDMDMLAPIGKVNIKGKDVPVRPSDGNNNELFLGALPRDIEDIDVTSVIKRKAAEIDIEIDSVIVIREKSFPTTNGVMKLQEEAIHRYIKDLLDIERSQYRVDLEKPRYGQVRANGTILFINQRDAERFVNDIGDTLQMDDRKIYVSFS